MTSPPGRLIVIVSWVATLLALGSVVVAVVAPGRVTNGIAVGIAVTWFVLGSAVAFLAFVLGIVRSARGDEVAVSNLFLLSGSAPKSIRRQFAAIALVSLIPVGVSFANLAIAPYTWLALMVPVGAPGLWAARYGSFPPRAERIRRPPPRRR